MSRGSIRGRFLYTTMANNNEERDSQAKYICIDDTARGNSNVVKLGITNGTRKSQQDLLLSKLKVRLEACS